MKNLIAFVLLLSFLGCKKGNHSKKEIVTETKDTVIKEEVISLVNPLPTWHVDERCFLNGPVGSFDALAVKDPSIVYYEGKYHLFYTGRDKGTNGSWRMGYAKASSIKGLKTAERTYMGSVDAGSYFCAPQVFRFDGKDSWFLIFQSGKGATFSVSNDVADPASWTLGKAMGFSDGIDFWCIADNKNVYVFYSAQDGSHNIKSRQTSITDFPYSWSEAKVAVDDTFEAPHVYKNKADGNYYMMVEDLKDNRYFELWVSASLAGKWKKVSEKWASYHNLVDNADHWTDQVSHGEVVRSSNNQLMEVDNIDHCDVLIQGVKNGNYGDYGNIPYQLGLMRNY
ncbi:hypothetical protein BCY91_17155 [Pelobium manganitolerans]|uniref:non-reducing end alpha-L-arabinofuranosidase n=1 Tax=Pelobium manganitolerans TaxID=1842495 RepID=A0A419S6T2_9SPHI|nr:non-reducing end alpha-L-arabinofuranosidase family hydrolase [Pelobium manganitolerans]RKD16583.1 hypothetical protein BCY91_17155 [Pelobium manganitolerans]